MSPKLNADLKNNKIWYDLILILDMIFNLIYKSLMPVGTHRIQVLKTPLNILKLFSTHVVLTSRTCFCRTFSEYKKNTPTLLKLSITLIASEHKIKAYLIPTQKYGNPCSEPL